MVTQRVQGEVIFMVIGSSIGLHVEAFCRQFRAHVTTARKANMMLQPEASYKNSKQMSHERLLHSLYAACELSVAVGHAQQHEMHVASASSLQSHLVP